MSMDEWGVPQDMRVTIVKKGSRIQVVLYNGRPLPPHLRDTLKVEYNEGMAVVTLSFCALDVVTEEAK